MAELISATTGKLLNGKRHLAAAGQPVHRSAQATEPRRDIQDDACDIDTPLDSALNRSTRFRARLTQDVWEGCAGEPVECVVVETPGAYPQTGQSPSIGRSRDFTFPSIARKPRDLDSSTSRLGPDPEQIAGRARRDALNIGLLDHRQRLLCHAARESASSAWEPQFDRDLPRVSSPGRNPLRQAVGTAFQGGINRSTHLPVAISRSAASRVSQQAREVSRCPSDRARALSSLHVASVVVPGAC